MEKKDAYYIVYDWFYDLGIKNSMVNCFALIYGFAGEGKTYNGGVKYIANRLRITSQNVMRILKELTSMELLIKTSIGTGTGCDEYRVNTEKVEAILNDISGKKMLPPKKSLPPKKILPLSDKKSLPQGGKKNLPHNNKDNNKEDNKDSKDKSLQVANATAPARRIDYNSILAFFNEQMEINGANIQKIDEISDSEKRWIRARLAKQKYGIEDIKKAIQKAAVSDFMNGRCRGSDWIADLGWIVKTEENLRKVLKGNYDNKEIVKSINTQNHGTSRRDIEEMQRRDEAAALVARLIAENE